MNRRILTLLFFLATCLHGLGQSSAIDSLKNVLKMAKEDTNKVNLLNTIADKLQAKGRNDSALSYATGAKALAEKLDYKSGLAMTLRNTGNIYCNRGDFDKAMECLNKALDINRQINNRKGIAGVLSNMAYVYWSQNDYPHALEFYKNATSISEEIGNKGGVSKILSNVGLIYFELGNYPLALENEFKALGINKQIGSKENMVNNLGNIGLVYEEQGNNKQALEYYQQALAMEEEIGDKKGISADYCNMGNIHTNELNYSRALECYLKSLDISTEIGDKYGMAIANANIGGNYAAQGNYPSALEYYSKGIAMNHQIGNVRSTAIDMVNIGIIYTKLKKFKPAVAFLDSGLMIAEKITNKEIIKSAYEALATFDSAGGNYKQALEDYKKYIVYRDSLVNDANTKKTVQAEMNYEFEQKQTKEKAEQDKKDAIAEQDRNKQKIIRNSFIAGFALMLALAFFIFRGYRQKQKANIIITQQKEEVENQKTLVEQQKGIVEEKNRDILDSIIYAKRLQDAILPPTSLIKQFLPESFVTYKPKDIVAGDFYWLERVTSLNLSQGRDFERSKPDMPSPLGEGKEEVILIAAADCTGHGVPGALVSVVCSNALNRTVKEFKIIEPGKILDKVRELVLETFEKSGEIQDGMDISLCCINTNTYDIQWSGAYNSLWYVQNNEIKELPADKQPIGANDKPAPFNTHYLKLQKGDTLYLFTDGYADQFGGEKGKKFKYKQLQQLIMDNSQLTMEEQKKTLENKFEEWKGELEQIDDVLIIGIRV
ncbi:MAG TPA: tetratricopeptide repeat protein [Bacteroidia bacterium]|nr:tetratricopeptide repeat protein [Bacteroidia bacterium]